MRNEPKPSDLDLVIVDEGYFARVERELQWWEERNPIEVLKDEDLKQRARDAFLARQQARQFNCCRDQDFPFAVCVHHQDTMQRVAELKHCGLHRKVSAFIYPDWLSARRRYDYDLRKLVEGVERGELIAPGDEPLPA
jgi:hypothetical protein